MTWHPSTHVMVGDEPCRVSWQEYYVSILPKGTPVRWTKDEKEGTGIFEFAYFYDGVMAVVELYGGNKLDFFLSFGDKVRRLKDTTQLVAPGIGGDGI